MGSEVGSLIRLFTKNQPNSVNVSLAKHCMNKLPLRVKTKEEEEETKTLNR